MFFSPRFGQIRRRRRIVALAAFFALAALAIYLSLSLRERPPSIANNPTVEFNQKPEKAGVSADLWPLYGYDKTRTRSLSSGHDLKPPFQRMWANTGSILLEFAPVVGEKSLFLLKNNGALHAISKKTGKGRWKRLLGRLAASSPAYGHGVVYVVLLSRGDDRSKGRVVAVTGGGRTRWSRKLPSRAESSPLLHSGRLYFGSEDGTVFALRSRDGSIVWTRKTNGAVKGGVAYDSGRLYFGTYGGSVYSLRASDGKVVWSRGGSGNFYSTPAVQYGRVYLGSVDGRVYSFAQANGDTAWAKQTGGYVYGSPAVTSVGSKPSVFIGSYSGVFYSLNARTGRVRWSFRSGGKISGGASVVDDVVYFSDLGKRTTYGLDASSGEKVFTFGRGAFNPVVSDGKTIFLTGYSSLYGLKPKDRKPAKRRN